VGRKVTVWGAGRWAGVENAWEQINLEARRTLDAKPAAREASHTATAPQMMGKPSLHSAGRRSVCGKSLSRVAFLQE